MRDFKVGDVVYYIPESESGQQVIDIGKFKVSRIGGNGCLYSQDGYFWSLPQDVFKTFMKAKMGLYCLVSDLEEES